MTLEQRVAADLSLEGSMNLIKKWDPDGQKRVDEIQQVRIVLSPKRQLKQGPERHLVKDLKPSVRILAAV
jgi:hypothetical protein